MKNNYVLDIIHICVEINQRAAEIYLTLSKADKNEKLSQFWEEMATEEKTHTIFWKIAQESAEEFGLPHVFDDPMTTRKELERILDKVIILLKRWESDQNLENALILAYRLEYSMLHPAFGLLYHTLKPLTKESNPEYEYDLHINRFIKMFLRYGNVTPALGLLGETLRSLWERNKKLTKLVMIDGLTGLLNRRGFLILAKELAFLAQRNKENMGLLMIDIDKFKKINDTHGHPIGDEVLKGVADTLKSKVRKSDIIGRFGGEEFIILFPAIQPDALIKITESLRESVESARPVGVPVTISIGVKQGLIVSDPEKELFVWIANADDRLYQAKENGRNCIVTMS